VFLAKDTSCSEDLWSVLILLIVLLWLLGGGGYYGHSAGVTVGGMEALVPRAAIHEVVSFEES
jgi:hypothetical protein